MAISGVLQNALSTATGTVAKARIKIMDERNLKTDTPNRNDMSVQKKEKGVMDLVDLDSQIVDMRDLGGKITSKVQTATSGLGQRLVNLVGNGFGADMDYAGYNRVIEVQFNPASLRISSNASDEDMEVMNFTQDGSNMERGSADLHIDLSMKLIFDQISNTGAFEQDNLTLSTSRIMNSAVKGLENLTLGRNTQSIQVTVEAFIAMLRNPLTRRICFQWGEFNYEGIVTNVNSNYTMFDINGLPIRAEVGLTMYLIDPDITSRVDNTGYWYDAYHACFIDGNPEAEAMMAMSSMGL